MLTPWNLKSGQKKFYTIIHLEKYCVAKKMRLNFSHGQEKHAQKRRESNGYTHGNLRISTKIGI